MVVHRRPPAGARCLAAPRRRFRGAGPRGACPAPGFEATWFAGTDTNTAFGDPWLPADSITGSIGTASLQSIAALRDEATAATRQRMAAHPGQTTFWSPPAISQLHRQLVVSHGARVLIDGAYRGEVSVDIRLDALQQRVAAWAREAGLPGLRLWVLDQAGQVVADAGQAWPGAAARAPPRPRQHVPGQRRGRC